MNIIEMKNIYKTYNLHYGMASYILDKLRKREKMQVNALQDIDINIQQGVSVGFIGLNGSGKTTALKLIAGITRPSSGQILVKGKVGALIQVGTGFHPELTGRENVFLYGVILGMSRKYIKSRFNDIVDFAGLGDFMDTPVKKYSSGMYIRLGFSVAAHLEPDIILIDEVLAVGDYSFREKSLNKIKEIKKQGTTIVFVSHNLEQVRTICDRTVYLEKGRVKLYDETNKVIKKYITDIVQPENNDIRIEQFSEDINMNVNVLSAVNAITSENEIELKLNISNNSDMPLLFKIVFRGCSNNLKFVINSRDHNIRIDKGVQSRIITVKNLMFRQGLYALDCELYHYETDVMMNRIVNVCYFEIDNKEKNDYGDYELKDIRVK